MGLIWVQRYILILKCKDFFAFSCVKDIKNKGVSFVMTHPYDCPFLAESVCLAVNGVHVSLLRGCLERSVIVADLTEDDDLVADSNLGITFNPSLAAIVIGAVDLELVGSGTIVRDEEGGCAILSTEGVLDG